MKMKHALAFILAVFLLTPAIFAQDLSTYRDFSLGMHLADVAKRANKTPTDATVIQQKPALIQELAWWPMQSYEPSAPSQSVQYVLFSFYNGDLYKIAVTYDTTSTKGLTTADMIDVVSAKYGVENRTIVKATPTDTPLYSNKAEIVASWEGAQYTLALLCSPSSNDFQLVLSWKQMDSQAEAAIALAATQAVKDAPQAEIAREKQEAEDLETTRQANLKTFQP
jgi:hypothetical protein